MYWTGDQKRTGKTQRKPTKEDKVSILPIIYEEKQEITSNAKRIASFDIRNLEIIILSLKLARLLLRLHNHNSIYTSQGLVILREIAIQEVHPCLAGQQLNEARIAAP